MKGSPLLLFRFHSFYPISLRAPVNTTFIMSGTSSNLNGEFAQAGSTNNEKYNGGAINSTIAQRDAGFEDYDYERSFEENRVLERKLVRKIDLRLCTIAGILCSLNLLDSGIISSASVTSIFKDLGLGVGNRYVSFLCFCVEDERELTRKTVSIDIGIHCCERDIPVPCYYPGQKVGS